MTAIVVVTVVTVVTVVVDPFDVRIGLIGFLTSGFLGCPNRWFLVICLHADLDLVLFSCSLSPLLFFVSKLMVPVCDSARLGQFMVLVLPKACETLMCGF